MLAAAKPAVQHPEYDREERATRTAVTGTRTERERPSGSVDSDVPSGEHSAVFDLDMRDVTERSWGSRDINPLGHHGSSENYYVFVEQYGIGYDHKYKVGYNALTHLLVEAGERHAENPNGRLTTAKFSPRGDAQKGVSDSRRPDPPPCVSARRPLTGCASGRRRGRMKLPAETYNGALDIVRDEYGVKSENDTDELQFYSVEWADVADWGV